MFGVQAFEQQTPEGRELLSILAANAAQMCPRRDTLHDGTLKRLRGTGNDSLTMGKPRETTGKPWETMGKPSEKWWLNVILWHPSGNLSK